MFRGSGLARYMFVVGAAIGSGTCGRSSPPTPSSTLTGAWGGHDIALTVKDTESHVEFDCAHGDIPSALTVNLHNQFNISGTLVREHGGPIQSGDPSDVHPANYAGSVTGTAMILSVRLMDTNEVVGTFTLTRDAPGRVVKCLLALGSSAQP